MARLNVEAFLVSYLSGSLEGVTVRTRVPDPRPQRLVVVTRSGGGRDNSLQDRPGVHLTVYGGTEWETSELAGQVGDLMLALNRSDAAMLAGVSRVEEESLRSDSYTLTTHSY